MAPRVNRLCRTKARFTAYAAGPGRRKIFADARRHFKAVPAAEYPHVVALADDLTEDAQDDLFEFGIEMCLRGLDAMIKTAGAR